jgi:hypothetical protein
MYRDVVKTKEEGKFVLVLDTEGLGAMDVNKKSDSRYPIVYFHRIFLLAILLASQFIYNSVGTIDENALGDLGLIVNLAKSLSDKQKHELNFPRFLWVLRDFTLQL